MTMKSRCGYAWAALGSLVRRVVDDLPGEGEKVVKAYWTERAKARVASGDLPKGDAGAATKAFVSGLEKAGVRAEVVSCQKEKGVFRIDSCPFGFQAGDERYCDINMIYDILVIEGAGCTVGYPKRLAVGDHCCEVEVILSQT